MEARLDEWCRAQNLHDAGRRDNFGGVRFPQRAGTSRSAQGMLDHRGNHEVLKLCVVQGVRASNLGVPIPAEELERFQQAKK
jgi:hypothetical protein